MFGYIENALVILPRAFLCCLRKVDVYFAHAYSSYERGTNENFNGLLREFIPKRSLLKELN